MLFIPKKTIEAIVSSQNHYVAQVKGNQKSLFEEAQRIIVQQQPLDYYQTHETGHGRKSSWFVSVYDAQNSPKALEWLNLRRVIHVHRIREEKQKITHANSLYISDLFQTDAQFYQKGIRGHWGIENSLHYVKDVVHNEDDNRIKAGTGPMAASIFSTVAINIHRKDGFQSISEAQTFAIKNINDLICKIRT